MATSRPIFARVYASISRIADERLRIAEHRAELLDGIAGTVAEVGAGNGLNFAHYGVAVDRVIALEPERHLRRLAVAEGRSAPVPVHIAAADALALPLADGSMDAVVFSLVLCSVPDQAHALAEARRVLRPAGVLAFYEHVRAQTPGHARFQRTIDLVWPWMAGGCHTARDTPSAIEAAGFEIEAVRRFDLKAGPSGYPVRPHAIGRARRPI